MKRSWLIILIVATLILTLVISIFLTTSFITYAKVKEQIDLGNKYLLEGRYDECILTLEKVINIDKKNVDARYKLTEAYLKNKQFEDANKISLEILNINPSDKQIYIKIADALVAENRLNDAVSYLKKAFDKTKYSQIESKLKELIDKLPLTTLEATISQDTSYNLPERITVPINNENQEQPVKWTDSKVDTSKTGTFTFEGSIEEYDMKVKLTLTVTSKDPFLIPGNEVSMSQSDKEAWDDFFTVFSMFYVPPFENSDMSDESLISFGISYINTHEWRTKVEKDISNPYVGHINASDVDEYCMYYFGKKPAEHKSVSDYTYSNGKYTFYLASGEAINFSQADRLFNLGNDLFRAAISIYTGSSGFSGNLHASPSELLNAKDPGQSVRSGKKMTAIVKKINENGSYRYILISYRVQDTATATNNSSNTAIGLNSSTALDTSHWKASASSYLNEGSIIYKPELINDGNVRTAWVEGAKDDGIGEWIKLSDQLEQSLMGLKIINGYASSSELYNKNNRAKKIRIEFSNGSYIDKDLIDGIMDFQAISFNGLVKTSYIKITLLEVYRGSQYRDTCLSEVILY